MELSGVSLKWLKVNIIFYNFDTYFVKNKKKFKIKRWGNKVKFHLFYFDEKYIKMDLNQHQRRVKTVAPTFHISGQINI